MAKQVFLNNFRATLAASLAVGATTATLSSGSGAVLGTLSNGDYYLLTVAPADKSESSQSVIKVTGISGDVVTIDAAPAAWPAGSLVQCRIPAEFLNSVSAKNVQATSGQDGYLAAADYAALQKTRNDYVFAGAPQTVTTSATLTTGPFVAVAASVVCNGAIVEAGEVAIQYQRNGTGAYHTIDVGERKIIYGITNLNQLGFRRADYATIVANQVTTVTVQPINTGRTFSVTQLNVTANSNNTWLALASNACTAVFLRNVGLKEIWYDVDSSAVVQKLGRGRVRRITGITNSNQIRIRCFDSQSLGTVEVEIFNGEFPEEAEPEQVARRATPSFAVEADFFSGIFPDMGEPQMRAGIPQHTPFLRYNAQGRTLATWDYVANATLTYTSGSAGVSLSDAASTEAGPNWHTIENTFSTDATPVRTALRATWAGAATVLVKTAIGAQIFSQGGVDCTKSYIFSRLKLVSGTAGQLLKIRLYDTDPTAARPTSWLELDITNETRGRGYSNLYSHAHRGFHISKFTQVGSGTTDLTKIMWAEHEIAGTSGKVVQFGEIRVVPQAFNKAHFYLFGDDTKASFIRGVRRAAQRYGFPICMAPSPAATTVSVNRLASTLDIVRLQREGSQMVMQDMLNDTGTNNNIHEQMVMVNRWHAMAGMYGMSIEGVRDASIYGGGISNGSDPSQRHNDHRFSATSRGFDTNGDSSSTTTGGNVFPFVDTMPPADPWGMLSLSASNFTGVTDPAVLAAAWQRYGQQCIDICGVGSITWHDEGESALQSAAIDIFFYWLYQQQVAGKIVVTTPEASRRAFIQSQAAKLIG